MSYVVYIVRCADGTFYTGITNDLQKRITAHNESPVGAKYTKARRPVALVYQEGAADRGAAQSREYTIRKLSRAQKKLLIDSV